MYSKVARCTERRDGLKGVRMTTRHKDGIRVTGSHDCAEYTPYQRLGAAVVTRAIRDWERVCNRRITRSTENYRLKLQRAVEELQELREYFESPWCEICCPYDTKILLDKMLAFYSKSRLRKSIIELW